MTSFLAYESGSMHRIPKKAKACGCRNWGDSRAGRISVTNRWQLVTDIDISFLAAVESYSTYGLIFNALERLLNFYPRSVAASTQAY